MTHPASNYSLRFSLFRHQGIIPARRHDAFLLSLLLALLVNIIFFTLQAILPAIIFLLTLLGANPAPRLEEEKELPFILVDPSELVTSVDNPEAMGEVSREERQTEATPEAEDLKPRIDEGVEEILSLLPGNPALSLDGGEAGMESAPTPPPPETPPAVEAPQAPETPPQEEAPPAETPPTPTEPTEEPPPPETPPTPSEVREEPPPPETPPTPTEAIEEPPPEVTPPQETRVEEVELALLSRQDDYYPPPPADSRPPSPTPVELPPPRVEPPPPPPLAPDTLTPPPAAPAPERPQPVFKKIGSANPPSGGGTPLRRSRETAVKLIGEDASMRILQHRWGPYMAKVARQLQESLNRQMILNPLIYSTGQIKLRFGIAPDGKLSFYETVFALDSMEAERILSERMLREAAPFDPLTPDMQKDENFQNLTVVVHLL